MTVSDGIIWHGGAMTGIYIPPNRAVLETSDGRLVQKGSQIGDGMYRRRRRQQMPSEYGKVVVDFV